MLYILFWVITLFLLLRHRNSVLWMLLLIITRKSLKLKMGKMTEESRWRSLFSSYLCKINCPVWKNKSQSTKKHSPFHLSSFPLYYSRVPCKYFSRFRLLLASGGAWKTLKQMQFWHNLFSLLIVIECFRLEGALKTIWFQPLPCLGTLLDRSGCPGSHGASTASLDNLF